jgi:hypothetical protein
MLRWSMGHEEIREAMKHVIRVEPSLHQDGETLATEFVDDRQHLDRTTIVRVIYHEVIGPDVVAMGGPEPDTRPIIEPQTSPFALLLGNLQPLLTPDTFHSLVIDPPTLSSDQGCDTAVPVTPIPLGKLNNFFPKLLFGIFPLGYEPLGGPRLANHPARTPLRHSQFLSHVEDASSTPLGA